MFGTILRSVSVLAAAATLSCATVGTSATYDSITLTRTVCFGFCPAYTVTMYSDGKVVWEGFANVETEGKDSVHLDPKVFAEVESAFHEAEFLAFEEDYRDMTMTDCPSAILEVRQHNMSKTVHRYTCDRNAPEVLQHLEKLVDSLSLATKWIGNPEFD